MKKLMIIGAAFVAGMAFAQEAQPELEKGDGNWNNWRVTVGGFGRGHMKAKVDGMGSDRFTAYGADLDFQYNVWQNKDFNLWAGIGGTFCPRQDASGGFGGSRTQSTHNVSDDGSTTIDFNYNESNRGKLDLGYGEFRMMLVPEWKVTDDFALGVRVGAAFDWINAKYSQTQNWAWNQTTVIDVPPYVHETLELGDSGSSSTSDSETKFAAQAILGLQATYMFTDYVGLYANFDWRLGGETKFSTEAGDYKVDMSGYYWGAGVVVSF